ncbi:3,4-dihydroxy-2-butanone-4-phosphate synthase [Sphingomonas sp. CGMCC 1.13654]|uniref:3,4-dihydroxy-2-butanone 4-phosphate synthase n=1 Tax=Sphingomonas chungangi TaxID=2683589 RepID=A0A838L6Q0_9SPHN|nr:3,4-dihydroxy-2-butanone-4-phosphate synthase [Sphingomonas chungangi]MBA2934834.1 3,4-dihydroxy-2-butanone-4-phosphate synthase [Sphingomonas chungangi]MVW58145.1 hypothetical protein [Sphingomonas chungangi]
MTIEEYDGRLAILIDPAAREGRGRSLIFAAARDIRDEDVITLTAQGGICTVTINEGAMIRLGLSPQGGPPPGGDAPYFGTSAEARACTETGISAKERALTMRTLGGRDVGADDIQSPGHIMVQVARNVLRDGASLPEMANALLAATTDTRFAAWADILDASGEVAGADDGIALARRLDVPHFLSSDVIRLSRERLAPWVDVMRFSQERFGA